MQWLNPTPLFDGQSPGDPVSGSAEWREETVSVTLALIQVFEQAMDNGSDVEEESDDEVEPCGGSARGWCA